MKTVKLQCAWCNKSFEIRKAEYTRQLKCGRRKDYFFCGLSCVAKCRNSKRRTVFPITKTCKLCGKEFITHTGKGEAVFCSRSCASKGSVTQKRREAARKGGLNPKSLRAIKSTRVRALGLRSREKHRYVDIEAFLQAIQEPYKIEYFLGEYIFDLALTERKVLVEFDGRYHGYHKQVAIDKSKDKYAQRRGWTVIRIRTDDTVYPSSLVERIVS
jgi:very-short-patch-repair endonuclease